MKEYAARDPNSDLNSVFQKVDEKIKMMRRDPPKLSKVLLQPSFEVKRQEYSYDLSAGRS